jgi:hypothetical protein
MKKADWSRKKRDGWRNLVNYLFMTRRGRFLIVVGVTASQSFEFQACELPSDVIESSNCFRGFDLHE